jgi:hypothetical protein
MICPRQVMSKTRRHRAKGAAKLAVGSATGTFDTFCQMAPSDSPPEQTYM